MIQNCQIIGVLDNGVNGLTPEALTLIQQADVVIGGTRTLELFSSELKTNAIKKDLTGGLTKVPDWVNDATKDGLSVVVLATGDPLCHGIGAYLIKKIGIDHCTVVPNVSTIQLACARLGLSWQDIKISSVHSKDAGEWNTGDNTGTPDHGLYKLLQDIQQYDLLAILTSPENTPDRIARMMINQGLDNQFTVSIAERLLQTDENIIRQSSVSEMAKRQFTEPNIMILQRLETYRSPILFGLEDAAYKQRKPDKGLITKREVRAVSLARMQLRQDSIIWDIGAGSGAVGLEAARLCPQGHVYAIEKNEADVAIALDNRRTMKLTNYSLTHAKAPEQLADWPAPNAIFIGGSAGQLDDLIKICLSRLLHDGWLVMNFVTMENLATAIDCLKQNQAGWDVTQIQASRSQPILNMNRLAAENPVWIASAQTLCTEKAK